MFTMVNTREHNGDGNGGETVKRVHPSFRDELNDIRKQIEATQEQKRLRKEKILSDTQITKLIVRHNSWPLIKKEIILRGLYGDNYAEFVQ